MSQDASTLILETNRLVLRHLNFADLDALSEIQDDPEVMRFFPSGPRSNHGALHDLGRCIDLQRQHGFSLWAAIDKANGQLIGRCGFFPHSLQGRQEVELSYLIARSHWGRGLATEAVRAILEHGFDRLLLTRIFSIIHRDNLASRRVAEKAGLRPEGIIQFMKHRCWLYAIEARDRGER